MGKHVMIGEGTILVRMAEMAVARDDARLKTTLGSCVGLFLHDPVKRITTLAHIVLPSHPDGDTAVAKYADTAIPALLKELLGLGATRQNVKAYLAGGAHLFGSSEDIRLRSVGDLNVTAARNILAQLGIEIVFEDTGGERGRIVVFENRTGTIDVKTLSPPVLEARQ